MASVLRACGGWRRSGAWRKFGRITMSDFDWESVICGAFCAFIFFIVASGISALMTATVLLTIRAMT